MESNGHQTVKETSQSGNGYARSPNWARTSTSQGTGSAQNVRIGTMLAVSSATSGTADEPTGSVGTGSALRVATTTMALGQSAECALARLQGLRGQLLESRGLDVREQIKWFYHKMLWPTGYL